MYQVKGWKGEDKKAAYFVEACVLEDCGKHVFVALQRYQCDLVGVKYIERKKEEVKES